MIWSIKRQERQRHLARSEGIHHWEPAWELLLTFRWSFERLNISIHLILWCPPWPALLKNKFCSILTFLANLDKKKKIKNVNLARLCARLKPVFLSKKGPSKARLLTKMSLSEELGTLQHHQTSFSITSSPMLCHTNSHKSRYCSTACLWTSRQPSRKDSTGPLF